MSKLQFGQSSQLEIKNKNKNKNKNTKTNTKNHNENDLPRRSSCTTTNKGQTNSCVQQSSESGAIEKQDKEI